MPTMCIQCAMRALLAGQPAPSFDETPDEHLRRCHADVDATLRERAELERQLDRIARTTGDSEPHTVTDGDTDADAEYWRQRNAKRGPHEA